MNYMEPEMITEVVVDDKSTILNENDSTNDCDGAQHAKEDESPIGDWNGLAKSIESFLGYKFTMNILIKPLDKIMVKKEITEMIPTGERDENGINQYETKTEIKDVESKFAKGIIISIPVTLDSEQWGGLEVGDEILYIGAQGTDFDVYKDSKLVNIGSVVAIKNKKAA